MATFTETLTREFIEAKKKLDLFRFNLSINKRLTTHERINAENALVTVLLQDMAAVILLNVGLSYSVQDLLPLFQSFCRGEDPTWTPNKEVCREMPEPEM
jgi:hypothetical protein